MGIPLPLAGVRDQHTRFALERLAHKVGTDHAFANEFRPEDFGAKGNGVTDDTAAFQRCIDAIFEAGKPATVRLDPTKTYVWDSDPRTDRGGNCIVSMNDTVGSSTPVAFVSADQAVPYPQMATIRTNRTGDDYSASYGVPSMLGGVTPEQGWSPSFQYCGPVTMHGVRFSTPENPEIAGIDGRSFGGISFPFFAIQADNSTTVACTHGHAVGLFSPGGFNFGTVDIGHGAIAGFYAGVVPHKPDHLHWGGLWIYNCVGGIAFEDASAGSAGSHSFAGGYVGIGQCNYGLLAWKIVAGVPQVGNLSVGHKVFLNPTTVEMEVGTGDFALINTVLDGNNSFYGDLHISLWNGLGMDDTPPVNGAQNLRITSPTRKANGTTATIASAGTITLPGGGSEGYLIDGTNNINTITPSWSGRVLALIFLDAATAKDGTGNLKLDGGADFAGGADRVLTLICDGTDWYEMSRSSP